MKKSQVSFFLRIGLFIALVTGVSQVSLAATEGSDSGGSKGKKVVLNYYRSEGKASVALKVALNLVETNSGKSPSVVIEKNQDKKEYFGTIRFVEIPLSAVFENLNSQEDEDFKKITYSGKMLKVSFIVVGDFLILNSLENKERLSEVAQYEIPELRTLSREAQFSVYHTDKFSALSFIDTENPESIIQKTFIIKNQNLYETNLYIDFDQTPRNPKANSFSFNSEERLLITQDGSTFSFQKRSSSHEEVTSSIILLPNSSSSRVPVVYNIWDDPRLKDVYVRGEEGSQPVLLADLIKNKFNIIKNFPKYTNAEFEALEEKLEMAQIGLLMDENGSVRITGAPGIGKTYFSNLLLSSIFNKIDTHPDLKRKVYISMDAQTLMHKYVGPFELTVNGLNELSKIFTVVLVIDNVHTLMGNGTHMNNKIDFFDRIQGQLSSGRIKIIGTTTDQDWERHFSGNRSLQEAFSVNIKVSEATKEETVRILKLIVDKKNKNEFVIKNEIFELVSTLASRFNPIGANPRKSIDLMNFIYSSARLKKLNEITPDFVIKSASRLYNFDLNQYSNQKIRENLEKLRNQLDQDLAGLDEEKNSIIRTLSDHYLHQFTSEAGKPLSILLGGRAGVGKSAISKSIAKGLNFKPYRMVMSQYGSISDLDSFKNELALAISKNPFSVIFMDEIEKAHPAVQQSLLGILDSGSFQAQLSKSHDFTPMSEVNASRVIFLAATNAGQEAKNDSEFVSLAKLTINEFLVDRFDSRIRIPNPDLETVKRIINMKWTDLLNRFQLVKIAVEVDSQQLLKYILRKIKESASSGDGVSRRPIGFVYPTDSHQMASDLSVRDIERIMKDISSFLSQYSLRNLGESQLILSFDESGPKVSSMRALRCDRIF